VAKKTPRSEQTQPAQSEAARERRRHDKTSSVFAQRKRTTQSEAAKRSGWPPRFALFLDQCDNRAMENFDRNKHYCWRGWYLGNAVANVRGPEPDSTGPKKPAGLQLKNSICRGETARQPRSERDRSLDQAESQLRDCMNWGTELHRQGSTWTAGAYPGHERDALSGGKPCCGRRSATE